MHPPPTVSHDNSVQFYSREVTLKKFFFLVRDSSQPRKHVLGGMGKWTLEWALYLVSHSQGRKWFFHLDMDLLMPVHF